MNLDQAFESIRRRVQGYLSQGLRVFASSSFQTQSIPLLHQLARIDLSIPIYFLDTGYHFPGTLAYKRFVTQRFGLRVVDVRSPIAKCDQLDCRGRLLFASDPDHCCYLNKVLPLEGVLRDRDVWISGLRKDQSAHRDRLSVEEAGPHGSLRFHPMLHWNGSMVESYIEAHDLPRHPLEELGYRSIGCEPCTREPTGGIRTGREGRWSGLQKTECGLHTELIGAGGK